ncbi:hypothetical protein Tco_1332877, partial [Tanacetum coccineum]
EYDLNAEWNMFDEMYKRKVGVVVMLEFAARILKELIPLNLITATHDKGEFHQPRNDLSIYC